MIHPYILEHENFYDSVVKYMQENVASRIDEWEHKGRFPDELFKELGAQGYLGLLIPEAYGGVGGDYKLAAAWCEAFGTVHAVGLTTAINMHSLVISYALARYGTEEAKQRWLPKAVTGEKIGAYAFTEPGAGSDLARLRTKAEQKNGKWVINGSKTFITNGARADFILVLARTDPQAGYKGFTTFVVDTKSPGFKVARTLSKVGWLSSDTAELVFENVEVEDYCILGKLGEGWTQAANSLNWERVMLTLTSLSGSRECLKASLKYADERQAFGKKISELGQISDYLYLMANRIFSGEALTYEALKLLSEDRDCRVQVALAKRLVCDDAVWIADRAMQIHGGYGYTTEFSPERWWRDLRLMPIGGGTSEVMANIVAKSLA